MTLLLQRSVLEGLIDAERTVRAVEEALVDVARGSARQPKPFTIPTGDSGSVYVVMAAFQQRDQLVVSKLLADIPGNRVMDLPVQRSIIVLSSNADGSTLAVLDGGIPTRERTAAMTAVATRALARPGGEVLGLIGAGGLAEPHIRAIRAVRSVRRIVVWSRTRERAARLVAQVPGVEVVIADSPREVAEQSDILCTLTPSKEPVLRGEWLRPGTHINAVGAPPRLDHRELDSEAVARSTVFVDDIDTSLGKSGDVAIPIAEGRITADHLVATIGDVLCGRHPGRRSDEEVTLFNSVGMGILDLAICADYVARARATRIGREVELGD